jgi:hypothetical protein
MILFVYGTLLDCDLLRAVLGRPPPNGGGESARLPGFRRVVVAGRTYPTLIRRTGGWVAGRLLAGLGREDWRRLVRYEGRDYRLRRMSVRRADGRLVAAHLFLCHPSVPTGRRSWHIEDWRKRFKRADRPRPD